MGIPYKRVFLFIWLSLGCFTLRITDVDGAGNVGCLFRPTICDSEEFCFNDSLFGYCKSSGTSPSPHRHQESLEPPLKRLLEKELKRLWVGGYRWHHEYTQCVVQNLLFADKHRLSYDPGLCARLLQMNLPTVTKDILQELEKIGPEELALIRFNPSEIESHPDFADEVFVPSAHRPKSTTILALPNGHALEVDVDKRREHFQLPEHPRHPTNQNRNTQERGKYFLKNLLSSLGRNSEEADETWINNKRAENDDSDRYPEEGIPVVETDLSSDMEQRPVYTEAGTQWIPVNNSSAEEELDAISSPNQMSGESNPEDSASMEDDEGPQLLRNRMRLLGSNSGVGGQMRAREANEDSFENGPRPRAGSENEDETMMGLDEERELWRPYLETSDIGEDPDLVPFRRPMRYDIKKPGPTFFIHEPDNEDESKEDENPDESEKSLLNLLKVTQHGREQNRFDGLRNEAGDGVRGSNAAQQFSSVRDLTGEEESIQDVFSKEAPTSGLTSDSDQKSPVGQSSVGNGWNAIGQSPPGQKEGPPHFDLDSVSGESSKREYIRPVSVNLPQAQKDSNVKGHFEVVDSTQAYLIIQEGTPNMDVAEKLVKKLESLLHLPRGTFSNIRLGNSQINFKVNPNPLNLNASIVVEKAENLSDELKADLGVTVVAAGIGDKTQFEITRKGTNEHKLFILTFVLCGGLAGILLAVAVVFLVRRHAKSRQKLQSLTQPETEASQDYQDLCRQRMQRKNNEKPEPIQVAQQPKRVSSLSQSEASQPSPSSRSSTSSWSEEPVTSNMDISTGHMILSYMEDHLKNKDRLEREWEALCAYEAEPSATLAATLPQNLNKNRFPDVLPYDHSRVVLNDLTNVSSSDYINASTITDHDPRNPAYIATQGPLPQTAADFWQMIWEQGSVVIVTLTRLMENGFAMCHRYWPEEGSEVYHIYEVHLVSEHIWCDDYLVRSFYLKNLKTSETRTVTQFHFLSWPENGVPASTKALLEFRRKVNKSYRGRSCPIVSHCSDGSGRTGTYCLIDMVLNRMAKGAKEIDIAATLEHIRDQRIGMVKTKAQFEFVLMAIAEEVHAILKALSQ